MGASNPHPHGQIWAGTALPGEGAREDAAQRAHLAATGRRLLLDYVDQETGGQRVVVETDEWLVVVPFWAAWPFETLLIPKRPAARLSELDEAARDDLAGVLHDLLGAVRRPVRAALPVLDGLAPGAVRRRPDRRTGRSTRTSTRRCSAANVRKFMVGYELLAETQRDLTAEDAAARLRAVDVRADAGPGAPARQPGLTAGGP